MTRLLNRGTMEDRIKEELESVAEGQNYAYIAIDLDNFKQVNDVYGHWVGDRVIMSVSNILRKSTVIRSALDVWAGMNSQYFFRM